MTSAEREGVKLKRWTRAEFEQTALILYQEHLELVEGDVIDKKGETQRHQASQELLSKWLLGAFGTKRVLREARIDVAPEDNPRNEPEPDLMALNRDMNYFCGTNPGPKDLLLVIEVADERTLGSDFHIKGPLYARAGIVEYWLLDIAGRRMIVHRDPQEGKYRFRVAYSEEENLAPLAAPESFLRVADAFAL
jgi:Uma2 family endonuclease